MQNEFKKVKVNLEGNPKTLSKFEVSYMTPEYGFDILYKFDERSIKPKIRYWYKLYETDFRGESFLIGLIAASENAKANEKYPDKKRVRYIEKLCESRITREQSWIFRDAGYGNIKWLLSLIGGFALGLFTAYKAFHCQ